MADVRVRHQIHQDTIAHLMGTDGGVYQYILGRAVLVQNGARRRVRVDTGRLRSSINITAPIYRDSIPGARIGSNVEYAPYVGTTGCVSCWGDYLREALGDIAD